MMKKIYCFFYTIFITALLSINILGQNSIPKSLEQMGIKYFDVNSKEVREQTKKLRADQKDILSIDNGEDIAFTLDNGINVQFKDGSGRRLLIARGSSYSGFYSPAWSLDGKKIAFAAVRTDPRVVDLAVANSDGSDAYVILTLNTGYYNSIIYSISWFYTNEYLMFSYWYNDSQANNYFIICTIKYNGEDFVTDQGTPDKPYCQYEPVENSTRYSYINLGWPPDFTSELRVSNLNGTNDVLWLQRPGVIDGLRYVCWNNANSIYTIIRNWSSYPDKEVMLRVDRVNGNTTYTPLLFSATNASLNCPTVSPDRLQLYITEVVNQAATMYLTTFDQSGNVINIENEGTGLYPNWRHTLPLPDPPVLLEPPDNATGVSINPTLSWQPVSNALSYHLRVFDSGGIQVYNNSNITSTSIQIGSLEYDTTYVWIVSSINNIGEGDYSSYFTFTTESAQDVKNEFHPNNFYLKQNFPNPFNPVTTIQYGIRERCLVSLKVYDLLGKEIATLVNEEKSPGRYEVEFDGSKFSGGIYFYRLHAGKFSETKKLILVK